MGAKTAGRVAWLTLSSCTTTTDGADCRTVRRVPYFVVTSPKTTVSAIVAAVLAIVYFALDRWVGVDIPPEVEGAIGVIVAALVAAVGTFARDNNVTSEQANLKGSVVGTAGTGSTIKLAEPVEVVEPSPETTPEPAAQAKDPAP